MTTPATIPPRPADFDAFRQSVIGEAMAVTAATQQAAQDEEAARAAAEERRAADLAEMQSRIAALFAPPAPGGGE